MLDASKGDSFCDGIQNVESRLDKEHANYSPFGPDFPMMLLHLCFSQWPRGVFGDLFLLDCVLEQGAAVTREALSLRLKAVFAGVYEPEIQMSMHTFYDPVVFDNTPKDNQGQDIPVLNASLVAAAHLLMQAGARGLTLAKLYGTQSEIQQAHLKFEVLMVNHWAAFRKMWRLYYLRRASDLTGSDGGDVGSGAEEGDRRSASGGQTFKEQWLTYVRECLDNRRTPWVPYLKLYDGGHWHKGSEARLIGVIEPDASSGHMFAAVTVALQEVCQRTEPDVVLTYVRPHEATADGHEMRCGPDALGPHDGGLIDWVCVACEEDWYELLCVALECKDVLDQGDVKTTSGQKAKVEVMHVAVWRWYENVWDVTTDSHDVVKAPMDFRTLPKDPDAAPNFGYTNVLSAASTVANAVTGAIVGVLTPTQGQRLLETHPGAWSLTVNEDLYICVETSQQSIGDVKAGRWGHQDDSAAAAGGSAGMRAAKGAAGGSAGFRGAKGVDKDEMRTALLSLTSQI